MAPACDPTGRSQLGSRARITAHSWGASTLEPTLVSQRYQRKANESVDTAVGRFDATRWTYTSLDSGWTSDLWVAGDIVVRYDRLFELEWYEAGASGPQPTTV